MKPSKVRNALAAITLLASCAAQAGFSGNTIQATACFPALGIGCTTSATVTAVVGAGTEFTNGSFGAFFGPTFDFADTTITMTHAASGHQGATFNGYDFFDANSTIADIIGVSIVSDSTGFFSGDLTRVFFDANHVYVNFQGLSFASLTAPQMVLSVSFGSTSVSEPGTLALLGLGLAGLAALRRRKQ